MRHGGGSAGAQRGLCLAPSARTRRWAQPEALPSPSPGPLIAFHFLMLLLCLAALLPDPPSHQILPLPQDLCTG